MKLSLASVSRWTNLTLGRTQPMGDSQRRYVRILQAAFAALAGKGVSVVVSFISVPLTIGYLGVERYGVWMTISALLAWLTIADLGLGNGLTNALAEAYAKERSDLAQIYVATTFWLLVVVALLFSGLIAACWSWIDWSVLFNVQSDQARAETSPAIALAIGITLLNLPLSVVAKIYGAYQERATANYWLAVGNIVSLFALIAVTRTEGGLVWLVAAFSGALFVVTAISAVWLFGWHKPWLRPNIGVVRCESVREILGTGGMFFVIQIAVLLIFQTDNLIIAHYLGASQVTPYSVAWRLFSYTTFLQLLIFPSLWPAYAEAFARKDIVWIKRTLGVNLTLSISSTVLFVILLMFFGEQFIEIWAGNEAVPPFSLLIWMGVWSIIFAIMSSTACILNGSGRIKGQMIYGILTAVVNIMLSVNFVGVFGITGVIAATVISYLVCSVVPQLFETVFILKSLVDEANT